MCAVLFWILRLFLVIIITINATQFKPRSLKQEQQWIENTNHSSGHTFILKYFTTFATLIKFIVFVVSELTREKNQLLTVVILYSHKMIGSRVFFFCNSLLSPTRRWGLTCSSCCLGLHEVPGFWSYWNSRRSEKVSSLQIYVSYSISSPWHHLQTAHIRSHRRYNNNNLWSILHISASVYRYVLHH